MGGVDDADAGVVQEFVRAPHLLGPLVASTVGYRSQGARPYLHRGVPSPWLTLIFSLDGPVVGGRTPQEAGGPDAARADIVLGGLQQRPAYVVQPERQTGIQLAVHPLAARTLLGAPASELSQLIGQGGDVLGPGAARLRERMGEETGWPERFALLSGYLRARAERSPYRGTVRPEVAEAWRRLSRHQGAGSMAGLARHVALSPRQLTTLFRREVGVSPKQAARLMRFQRALAAVTAAVAAGEPPDLSEVAARCGYYDHSHLVRDFRQYTEASPSAWLAEERRNIQAGGHRNGEEWDT